MILSLSFQSVIQGLQTIVKREKRRFHFSRFHQQRSCLRVKTPRSKLRDCHFNHLVYIVVFAIFTKCLCCCCELDDDWLKEGSVNEPM